MSHFEELLQCPYNRAHRILPHAMQRHLYKCRKNYPSTKLVSCPFNTIHRVPGPELKLHLSNCEDRATFDLYKYCISSGSSSTNSSFKDEEPELVYHHHDSIASQGTGKTLLDDDECWDDSDVPAYNPQQYCKTAKVIRKATLMKPSDKQQFYRDEQRRHKELDNAASDKKFKECRTQGSPNNNNNTAYDKPSFKGYRGPVPESKYYSEEPRRAPAKTTLLDDNECWDESDFPAYNPQEYCKNARIIRKGTHMQPSEKKQFYRQESQRLREIDGRARNVGSDVEEISAKFRKNVYVGCK